MVNLMFEAVGEWPNGTVAEPERVVTLGPGVRTGWNIGDAQAVVGIGVPIVFSRGTRDVALFGYLSYELPFISPPP